MPRARSPIGDLRLAIDCLPVRTRRAMLRAARAATATRSTPAERPRRDRWAWLRPGRRSAEDERALRRLEAELEALREREPIV